MKELARRTLQALDPAELPVFDSLADDYLRSPRRPQRDRTGPMDSGLGETVVALTPAVMWIAQCVTNAIIEYHIQKTIRGRRWLFRRRRPRNVHIDLSDSVATHEGWTIVQLTIVRSANEVALTSDQITRILEVLKPAERSGDQKGVDPEQVDTSGGQ